MDLTKKLREDHKNFELSFQVMKANPDDVVVQTTLVTFEFDGDGANARTNQKIVNVGEGKNLIEAKDSSLKGALELLGVLND